MFWRGREVGEDRLKAVRVKFEVLGEGVGLGVWERRRVGEGRN